MFREKRRGPRNARRPFTECFAKRAQGLYRHQNHDLILIYTPPLLLLGLRGLQVGIESGDEPIINVGMAERASS